MNTEERDMKYSKFFRAIFLIILSASLAGVISCAKEVKTEMYVAFFSGEVTLQRGGESSQVRVKDLVQEGDLFTVGEKSCLILHSTDGLVVRFEEETEAAVSSLKGVAEREVTLKKGKVLSSLGKLKKGEDYSVKTPTAVASVRGTQFLTEYNGKASVVAVGKGVVSVKRTAGTGDEKLVEKGNTGFAMNDTDTVEIRGVNKVETLELSKLEKTPVVESIDKKTANELKETFRDTEENDKEINRKIEEAEGLTFAEMKAKYGRIDVITLYSGKVIQGVILSRGATYKVLTTHGTIYIKAKDVRRTGIK